ncbi:MAG: 5-formyltetrahydrofolate cyclo-ligase [Clostridia bacterium]|nr:5-formyltetrahydrofolate cyclo-ligase [Clostridia bacterium]
MFITRKSELRNRIIADRKILTDKDLKDLKIIDSLFTFDDYLSCSTLLCYVSLPDEIDTRRIISNSFKRGKIVAVPFCDERSLKFKVISSFDDLQNGRFDIPTAKDNCPELIDFSSALCVTPCLSVDRNLNRLGYGGGYYDRLFDDNPDLLSVALCYSDFFVDNLPEYRHDRKVDYVITDKNVYGGLTDG